MAGFETQAFSEAVEVLGIIPPASYTTAQTTAARIPMSGHSRVVVMAFTGLIAASGTLDLKVEQANALTSGTVKAITGKAITQLTDTGDNKVLMIEILSSELDVSNGFNWLVVTATPATAASLLCVAVLGVDARYAPVGKTNVHQVVL